VKIFYDGELQKAIIRCVKKELIDKGFINNLTKLKLGLIAGNIKPNSKSDVESLFKTKGWVLRDAKWMVDTLKNISGERYEDNLMYMISKIIFRKAELFNK